MSAIMLAIVTAKLITIDDAEDHRQVVRRQRLGRASSRCPGSWNTVSMKITPVSEMTTMSMLSIATTGMSAFRSTCLRRTRHSLAPLARAVRT